MDLFTNTHPVPDLHPDSSVGSRTAARLARAIDVPSDDVAFPHCCYSCSCPLCILPHIRVRTFNFIVFFAFLNVALPFVCVLPGPVWLSNHLRVHVWSLWRRDRVHVPLTRLTSFTSFGIYLSSSFTSVLSVVVCAIRDRCQIASSVMAA